MNGSRRRLGKKSKTFWKQMKMNSQQQKNLWDTANAVLRGKFIAIEAYLKKIRNISNKQPNPMSESFNTDPQSTTDEE